MQASGTQAPIHPPTHILRTGCGAVRPRYWPGGASERASRSELVHPQHSQREHEARRPHCNLTGSGSPGGICQRCLSLRATAPLVGLALPNDPLNLLPRLVFLSPRPHHRAESRMGSTATAPPPPNPSPGCLKKTAKTAAGSEKGDGTGALSTCCCLFHMLPPPPPPP